MFELIVKYRVTSLDCGSVPLYTVEGTSLKTLCTNIFRYLCCWRVRLQHLYMLLRTQYCNPSKQFAGLGSIVATGLPVQTSPVTAPEVHIIGDIRHEICSYDIGHTRRRLGRNSLHRGYIKRP